MRTNKRNKKVYYFIFILLICVSLFIYSTYAWFTDTAVVKGNKVFAGNLYVDVICDEEGLTSAGFITSPLDIGDNGDGTYTVGSIGEPVEKYTRTLTDNSFKDYYILTDIEAPFIQLYNVEPGQAYMVKFGVLNSGDLAVKYTAGFQISKDSDGNFRSYTGLETLEKQKNGVFGVYHNTYQVDNGYIGGERIEGTYNTEESLSLDQYTVRKSKLEKMQSNNGVDIGGHLEDVLEVYTVDEESRINGQVTRNAIKDSNYIGTVKQMINLNDPSYIPSSEDERLELELVKKRIFDNAKGYLLPQDVIKNSNGKFNLHGVIVNIYDNDELNQPYQIGVRENVSEIDEVEYIIYMPEDASNIYQNASLFLDMGVTGTQVEFEYDGLNYMLYDNDYDYSDYEPEPYIEPIPWPQLDPPSLNMPNKGDIIEMDYGFFDKFLVLEVNGSIVKLVTLVDDYYWQFSIEKFGLENNIYKDSVIDVSCENFYENIYPPAKDNVSPITINCNNYVYKENINYNTYPLHAKYETKSLDDTIVRHSFSLDVEDIVKFFGGSQNTVNSFSSEDLSKLFYGFCDDIYIILRSSQANDDKNIYWIDMTNDCICVLPYDTDTNAYKLYFTPVFYIDLTGLNFNIIHEYGAE